ncbi:hypothetical protein D3C71_2075140 [compost metagenome]
MTRRIRIPGGVPLRLLGTAETAWAGGAEAGYTAAQAAEARHSQAGLTVLEGSEADILSLEPGTIQLAVPQ